MRCRTLFLIVKLVLVVVTMTATRSLTFAQGMSAGLNGMVPAKWITVKNTYTTVNRFRSDAYQTTGFSNRDTYIKIWLPLMHTGKFTLLAAPYYRTEDLETKNDESDPLGRSTNCNLRSTGVDFRSIIRLSENERLSFGFNFNLNSSVDQFEQGHFPRNHTFSGMYVKQKSSTEQIGFGAMVNNGFERVTVLPVFIYNRNYSSRSGLELTLPYKLAYRYNYSARNIFHIKAEGSGRNYLINYERDFFFSRTDLDLGLCYTRLISKTIGLELFAGYRQNVSTELPATIEAVKTSGGVFSVELFALPPNLKKGKG